MINAREAKQLSYQIQREIEEAEIKFLEEQFGYLDAMIKERIDQGKFYLVFDTESLSQKEIAGLTKFVNYYGYTLTNQDFGASSKGKKYRIDW